MFESNLITLSWGFLKQVLTTHHWTFSAHMILWIYTLSPRTYLSFIVLCCYCSPMKLCERVKLELRFKLRSFVLKGALFHTKNFIQLSLEIYHKWLVKTYLRNPWKYILACNWSFVHLITFFWMLILFTHVFYLIFSLF